MTLRPTARPSTARWPRHRAARTRTLPPGSTCWGGSPASRRRCGAQPHPPPPHPRYTQKREKKPQLASGLSASMVALASTAPVVRLRRPHVAAGFSSPRGRWPRCGWARWCGWTRAVDCHSAPSFPVPIGILHPNKNGARKSDRAARSGVAGGRLLCAGRRPSSPPPRPRRRASDRPGAGAASPIVHAPPDC